MTTQAYQRFAITIPESMAAQIEQVCKLEGRNRSEFFREAVRAYFSVKFGGKTAQFVTPAADEEDTGDPFRLFSEWSSPADAMYDTLVPVTLPPRIPGAAKGKSTLTPAFFEPLPEHQLHRWERG